jgi:hypothetical protein
MFDSPKANRRALPLGGGQNWDYAAKETGARRVAVHLKPNMKTGTSAIQHRCPRYPSRQ